MAEKRIPDPTLMARLQLSAKGVDWAASLVAHKQHEQPDGEWSAHQHLVHLLAVETEVYKPRVMAMLEQDRPVFQPWGAETFMADRYTKNEGDVIELAERFMREREKLVEVFKSLTPDEWARTGTWPDGEVDVAWAAERALAHGLEHFTGLLFVHQELEHFHARQWANAD
jgi:hypothetical protein